MLAGTAQIDITPQPGIELAGFAVRPQPSSGVLDRLAVRALYLEDGPEQLLWLHADLLALDPKLVAELRQRIERQLRIPPGRAMVSATHTHSGPAAIQLTGCGAPDPAYVSWMKERFMAAAQAAAADGEPCSLCATEGRCTLAIDRRDLPSAHTDPRVGAVAWRRADGSFKAVALSYAMHGVCLRGSQISGDWPGEAARALSDGLPGRPVALVCAAACCNLNPPEVGVTAEMMREWGRQVAASVLPAASFAPVDRAVAAGQFLKVARRLVPLPLEPSTPEAIARHAEACLADPSGHRVFGDKFRLAVETWRRHMTDRIRDGKPPGATAELLGIALGPVMLIGVSAEVFSRFTTLLDGSGARPIYIVSCANGMLGYVPPAEAYDEGGYEVDWSMFFYNMLRPKRGGLELLADQARALVADLTAPGPSRAKASPRTPGP